MHGISSQINQRIVSMIVCVTHKVTVNSITVTELCDANPARRHLWIKPSDSAIFIGGDELSTSDGAVGFRIASGVGMIVPMSACEAQVFGYGDDVEVEVVEFIQA